MKKFMLTLGVCSAILGGGLTQVEQSEAAHKTVEFGASWTYGSKIVLTGKQGYSNLASSTRYHSSSVTIGSGSAFSGTKNPGVEAKASRVASYTATVYAYYNIW